MKLMLSRAFLMRKNQLVIRHRTARQQSFITLSPVIYWSFSRRSCSAPQAASIQNHHAEKEITTVRQVLAIPAAAPHWTAAFHRRFASIYYLDGTGPSP